MSRIARFARNAGCRGTLMTAALFAIMGFLFVTNPDKADARTLVPVMFLVFFLMYPLRGVLVDNLETSRRVLTGALIAVGVAIFVMGRADGKPLDQVEGQIAIAAFLGAYMGCYFWLLSDPRVGRTDDP